MYEYEASYTTLPAATAYTSHRPHLLSCTTPAPADSWSHTSNDKQDGRGPLQQGAGQHGAAKDNHMIETKYNPLLAQALQAEDTEAPAAQLAGI